VVSYLYGKDALEASLTFQNVCVVIRDSSDKGVKEIKLFFGTKLLLVFLASHVMIWITTFASASLLNHISNQ
jgi:hypothetical protein